MTVSVLCFRGLRGTFWHLTALLVLEGEGPPPALVVDGPQDDAAPERFGARLGRSLWRYDFKLELGDHERVVAYGVGEPRQRIHLPALRGPLRIAFTACNGSEGERTGQSRPGRNDLWRKLDREHARAPFHLILHGGDQLYADSVWDEVEELAAWRKLPSGQRLAAPFTETMARKVGDYYFNRYCWLWEQPELEPLLPAVPSLMMWDDHDIFDGFGSHDPQWQACAVFQGIYAAARECFAQFQLVARPDALPAHGFTDPDGAQFGWSYRLLDGIGVLAPDLRSERTVQQIMGERGRAALPAMLDSLADCRHVLLVSTVPLLNEHEPLLERIYEALPGYQYFQLDVRDQWRSIHHRDEWLDLLGRLFAFSEGSGARVTALSGEIHLGALAMASCRGREIWQLTSSGIVHPPPSWWMVAFLDWLSTGPAEEVAPGLEVRISKIPGHDKRFLGERNWLALELSPAGGPIVATWHTRETTFHFER